MSISKSDRGFVGRGASVAHAFMRDQVLAFLAPVYLFRYGRTDGENPRRAIRTAHESRRHIEPHPSGVGHS